jgi:hypothetical protein
MEIAICKERIVQLSQDFKEVKQKKLLNIIFFFLLIPAYFAFTAHLKLKELQAEIVANEQKIAEFQKMHKEIFRDYKVTKLGIAYIPIAEQIPFEDKSFIIDYTNSINTKNFNLNTLKQAELFTNAVNDLDELMKYAPIIEKSEKTNQ